MPHQPARAGFTFVEILIAVLILAAGTLIFTGVMTATSSQSRAGGAATQAPLLATHVLETIKGDLQTGTHPTCGVTTHTHVRSGVTYTEARLVTPLAIDEPTGTLAPIACGDTPIHAYDVTLSIAWTADGVTHERDHSERISLAEHTPPRIDAFQTDTNLILNPSDPNANRVTLTWDIPVGGQPLDVTISSTAGHLDSNLPHRGSLELHVTRSARFTITATNPAGTHERNLNVYAIDVTLDAFTAHPNIVGPDEPFLLAWDTDGVIHSDFHRVTLQPLGLDVTSTDQHLMPDGITSTTTYTLEIHTRHESGMLIDSLDTTVIYSATPIVHDLTRDPSTQCAPGAPITIEWDVSAGYRVELDTGTTRTTLHEGSSGHGSATVPAAEPGTHTWDVIFTNRAGGSTTQSLTITTTRLPSITQTLTPNPVVAGAELTHAWSIDPATTATLNGVNVALTGSSTSRAISGTTPDTYSISATHDGCGAIPDPHTVTLDIQSINLTNVTLTSDHATPGPNEPITIAWAYTNTFTSAYHRVRIVDQHGTTHHVGSTTTATITIPTPGAYTFTVRLETTEATARLLHSVTLDPITILELPIATTLTLPSSVCEADPITAAWVTQHATTATINGATVTPTNSGASTYNAPHPSGARDFTLIASNAGGRTDTRSGSVTIQPAPRIDSFTISNPNPAAGETVTLTWSTSHASSVTLNGASVSSNGSTTRLILNNDPFELQAEPTTPCASATRATSTITPNTVMPSIESFTGGTIVIGASGTLNATLANFSSAHQTATILAPVNQTYASSSITQAVTPASTTTYTLRITSTNGAHILASATATITVDVPTISTFTVASGFNSTVFNGEPHGVRYELTQYDNALHSFSITGGGQTTNPTAASGSWTNIPNSDRVSSNTTYTATIRQRSDNSVLHSRSFTISVRAAPDASFSRSPTTATAPGAAITVSWSHNSNWSNTYHSSTIAATSQSNLNATSVSGSQWYWLHHTTTFQLTIRRRSDNTVLRTRSFTHTVQPPPTIASIGANPTHLCSDTQNVTVTWTTSNASTVQLYNSRDGSTVTVAANGSRTVNVAGNGFVRLTATNATGTAQESRTFTSAIVNAWMTVSPHTVQAGTPTTFTWGSGGGTSHTLTGHSNPGSSGSWTRTYTTPGTYTLTYTASNAHCSHSVHQTVSVLAPAELNMRMIHSGASLKTPAPSVPFFSTQGHTVNGTSFTMHNVPQGQTSITVDIAVQDMGARMGSSGNIQGGTNQNTAQYTTMTVPRNTTVHFHPTQQQSTNAYCQVGGTTIDLSGYTVRAPRINLRYNGSSLEVWATGYGGAGTTFTSILHDDPCTHTVLYDYWRARITVH